MGQRIFPHNWQEACQHLDCGEEAPKGQAEANYKKFLQAEMPSRQNEEWKYTPALELLPDNWKIAKSNSDVAVFVPAVEQAVVFVNGQYQAQLSKLPGAGVSVEQKNVPMAPDGVHGLSLFNFSFASTVVDVDIQQSLDKPLYFVFINSTKKDYELCLPNINVHVAKDTKVSVVEKYSSTCETGAGSTFSFIKYNLEQGAEVQQTLVQAQSKQSNLIYQMRSDVARQASFKSYLLSVGGALSRFDLQLALNESYSNNELQGVYVASGEQHMDMHTHVDHKVPHCKSNQVYRGILTDRSQGVFNGKLFVHRDAQVTRAMQSNKNLLLSDEAVVNTKPELEIYADDVVAAHGATIGQLDEQALYYLQSRGLSKKEARVMLTLAFADEVLQNVPNEAVVADVRQMIRHKLA